MESFRWQSYGRLEHFDFTGKAIFPFCTHEGSGMGHSKADIKRLCPTADVKDDKPRFMAILATLLGCQGADEFRAMLPAALNFGVTPVESKEIVYQAGGVIGNVTLSGGYCD